MLALTARAKVILPRAKASARSKIETPDSLTNDPFFMDNKMQFVRPGESEHIRSFHRSVLRAAGAPSANLTLRTPPC